MSGGFFTFHKSVIGYRHINEKIPCQDSSVSYTVDDGSLQIIAVGDGHGDPACHRSAKGSEFAVSIAEKCLKEFGKAIIAGEMDFTSPRRRRECIEQLTNTIILKWNEAIHNDLLENEINDNDLREAGSYEAAYREGSRLEHLFGTTLIAAMKVSNYFILIQQGDGRCDVFYEDGSIEQPIPWDDRCKGSITTSMCDKDVFTSIRSSVIDTGERKVAACYIGSDGVEDSYYDNEETQFGTHRFYMDLSCKLCELGVEEFVEYLNDFLPEFSRTGSADDISVAGIVDLKLISGLINEYKHSIERYDFRQSLFKRLEEIKAKLISMTRKHSVLKQRFAVAELNLKNKTDTKQQLDDELQKFIYKRNKLSKQVEISKTELEDYRKEAQEAKNSVEDKYQVITSPIRLFMDEITDDYSKRETDYNKMFEKISIYNEKIEKIEKDRSHQNSVIEKAKQNLIEVQEEFERYDQHYNDLSEELKKVQAEINTLTSEK